MGREIGNLNVSGGDATAGKEVRGEAGDVLSRLLRVGLRRRLGSYMSLGRDVPGRSRPCKGPGRRAAWHLSGCMAFQGA